MSLIRKVVQICSPGILNSGVDTNFPFENPTLNHDTYLWKLEPSELLSELFLQGVLLFAVWEVL